MKAGSLTPKHCRHPLTLAAKQTKDNRSRQIMQIQMMLSETCQIILSPAPTEQQTKKEVRY